VLAAEKPPELARRALVKTAFILFRRSSIIGGYDLFKMDIVGYYQRFEQVFKGVDCRVHMNMIDMGCGGFVYI
jgi:hypothetical protein